MTPEQMAQLDRLFEEGCAVPAVKRESWLGACCSDPEVRAELESLLRHAGPTGGFTAAISGAATESRAPLAAGQTIGPYRIVGILGEGGMGTVYEGVRGGDEFRQRVAIKVLRMSARSEAILRRFLQERRILAELEHPNIARLFDGGAADDGSPYIVMERIDGEPLTAFAKTRQLSIRQRLELFRQVANGVQYAHQKLIVHRDLKPGNILVGADGVPKLLDFGIAKLLDADRSRAEAMTATGFHLMTPDYASPEQVLGKPVTVASDVYSLGAVLYELLSGARPHDLKDYNPAEITEKICVREVAPPSAAGGPALRGDLDTIVLKAMQKAPERRYNSAEQFSEDIRRYLDGMPVMARPDTAGYRLRKFAGRHWVALGATAAVVVALSAGVAVSLYQARLARERFDLVRTLANRFLFDFHGEIATLSGSTKAQQMVVNTAVEYLEKLGRTAGSDPALLQDMAEAYGKLASVQGSGTTSNAGRFEDALASQRKSVEFYRRLVVVDRSNRRGLARSLLGLANIEQRLTRTADGLEHSREAANILDAVLGSGTPETAAIDESGSAYGYLSRSLRAVGRMEEALGANRKAQEYVGRVLATDKTLRSKFRLAVAVQDEGEMRTAMGDPDAGIVALERVSQTIEDLIAAEPGNRTYMRFFGAHLGTLAEAYYSMEIVSARDARKAVAAHEKRRILCRGLVDSDAADGVAPMDLAIAESESAMPLMELDPAQAAALAESGLARWDALLKGTGGNPFTVPRRARAAIRSTYTLLAVGRPREAIAMSAEAVATFRDLMQKKPDERYYQRSAVFGFAASGEALAAEKRDGEARKMYEEAASLAEQLRVKEQATLSDTVAAAYVFDRFGEYWKSRGDRAQALEWFERSRRAWAARPEKTAAVETRRREAQERVNGVQP